MTTTSDTQRGETRGVLDPGRARTLREDADAAAAD